MVLPFCFTRLMTIKTYGFIVILLSSCSINGNLKGLYSNLKKTKKENPALIGNANSSVSICQLSAARSNTKVVLTNGSDLRKCAGLYDQVLVYFWQPNCHGKYCYSLNGIQDFCTKRQIELFVVAEYFDSQRMLAPNTLDRPIFGIDTKYYKSNLTKRYLSKFVAELTARDERDKNFVLFKQGAFVKFFHEIDSL